MTRWVLAVMSLCACGKVEKLHQDAEADAPVPIDAAVDAAPDTAPVDPFVNGSFEQNYDGWTLAEDSGNPTVGFWGISPATTFAPGTNVHDYTDNVDGVPSCFNVGMNVVQPTDGTLAAFNAQGGPERHLLSQDVTLPSAAKMLTFSIGYTTNAVAFDPTNHFVAVEVRNPADNTVLGNLFITDPATTPPPTMPMTQMTASLEPYAGQTVRITVDVQAQLNCLFTVVDDFRVTF
jgi:hypothetical protein